MPQPLNIANLPQGFTVAGVPPGTQMTTSSPQTAGGDQSGQNPGILNINNLPAGASVAGSQQTPQAAPASGGNNQGGDQGFMGNVFGQGQGNWFQSILKNTIGSNGIGGLAGRPISSAVTAGAETGVANSKTQLSTVTQALLKKIQTLQPTDPARESLMQIVTENQKAMGISDDVMKSLEGNQETQEQNLGIAANSAATLAMGAATPATVVGKMGLNAGIGLLSGSGTAAANNEDAQSVAEQGVFGAATGAIISGVTSLGEKALQSIPTRLYSQFFKTTTDEFAKGMTTDAAQLLQKSDPATFQKLVENGIVKLNEDGTIQISKSTAQKALEAGIAGSPKSMGAQVAAKTMQLETQVQDAASKADPVEIGTWQRNSTVQLLQSFRDRIAKSSGGVFANALTDPLDTAIKTLTSSDGKISASDALGIRRMLDAMQKAKAYDPEANLSVSDSVLRNATSYFRKAVNDVPGMGDLMKQYSSYMDMLTDLQKRGAQLENTKAFNLFDLMAIMEGSHIAGGSGGVTKGVLMDALIRTITSARGSTYIAQGVNKVANAASSPVGQVAEQGITRGLSLLAPQAANQINPPATDSGQ